MLVWAFQFWPSKPHICSLRLRFALLIVVVAVCGYLYLDASYVHKDASGNRVIVGSGLDAQIQTEIDIKAGALHRYLGERPSDEEIQTAKDQVLAHYHDDLHQDDGQIYTRDRGLITLGLMSAWTIIIANWSAFIAAFVILQRQTGVQRMQEQVSPIRADGAANGDRSE
jgi:hypothetical protein